MKMLPEPSWIKRARRLCIVDNQVAEQLKQFLPNMQDFLSPSIPRTRISIQRDRKSAYDDLWHLYFSPNCQYKDSMFRRRFQIRRTLFFRIQVDIEAAEPYFTQRPDATGRLGLHSLQKMTVALRMLAYGVPADSLDEKFQLGVTTAIDSTKMFCKTIIKLYSQQYLRDPNCTDLTRLLKEGEERGFPGMLGSLDCMHWSWKNCPTAWHGQFRGHKGSPTLILEAVASKDLWIWHAFFGMAGSNNDITVLDHSSLFKTFLNGENGDHRFHVNGNEYNIPYYLTDGIYPPWSTLLQSISDPRTSKEKYYAKKHEGVRKDIERAFGVLQAKWCILHQSARFWHIDDLQCIMMTCLILHNMVIENERHANLEPWRPLQSERQALPSHDIQDPELLGQFLASRSWLLCD